MFKHATHLAGAALAFVLAMPAQAQSVEARAALNAALGAADRQDWAEVDAQRAQVTGQISRDLIDWKRLRGRQGSFAECIEFVARNADWPGMPLLRQRCEYSIRRGGDPGRVIRFFEGQAPRTGTGSLRLAEAYIRSGRGPEAAAELKRGWLTFNLSEDEHEAFVTRNGATIRDLHEARLDMLLWRDSREAVARMLPLVGEDWQRLAAARSALRRDADGVDALIEAVPAKLQDDPGLAFERFLWRARKGRANAVDLILERSVSVESLGDPEAWAPRRRSLARLLMREGKAAQAYSVASSHYLTKGSAFADLEWLSGFIALRYLDAPEQALEHFRVFEAAVATPISLGRAGYWTGRAHEALGQKDEAAKAYAYGARFQSSFYGQLAAERAGLPADPAMLGQQSYPDWRGGPFTQSTVFEAARLLNRIGDRSLSERFFVHLAETQSREAQGQLGDLALELEEPHIALMLAKEAARQGMELYKTYFPVALPKGLENVDEVFALSIARRESEFDPMVVSPVGARGLMQLMPGTAREMAGKLGEPYAQARLQSDPAYNARLGTAYLAELASRYQNNPVLMSIAYNAGPSRADRWMRDYGDPRRLSGDRVIDWIENIPFTETRNYVMRVTESFAPYKARLTGKLEAPRLTEMLRR